MTRYIKATLSYEDETAIIEIERKRKKRTYNINRKSYGFRNLPRILDKAVHVKNNPGHKKGDRARYVDAIHNGDLPYSTTYMFRDELG